MHRLPLKQLPCLQCLQTSRDLSTSSTLCSATWCFFISSRLFPRFPQSAQENTFVCGPWHLSPCRFIPNLVNRLWHREQSTVELPYSSQSSKCFLRSFSLSKTWSQKSHIFGLCLALICLSRSWLVAKLLSHAWHLFSLVVLFIRTVDVTTWTTSGSSEGSAVFCNSFIYLDLFSLSILRIELSWTRICT